MGGSKSSANTSSTTVTGQATQGADGLITAPVYNLSSTGGSVSLSTVDQFPEGVQEMTKALIDLLGSTIEGAGKIANDALQQVSIRTQEATQPDLTVVKYIPYFVAAIVGVSALAFLMRGK